MPFVTDPKTNEQFWVPGAYVSVDVVSDSPGALPTYRIPVLIGAADHGLPYNYQASAYPEDGQLNPLPQQTSLGLVQQVYGRDSDLAVAFSWAKRHNLPLAFIGVINPLTRATVAAESTGPIEQFTLFSKAAGAVGGHTKIAWSGGVLVVLPPKYYSLLVEDALTGARRIYVKGNTWARVGLTVEIGDNATANASYQVSAFGSEVGPTGQIRYWIEFTTTLAADVLIEEYGLVAAFVASASETTPVLTDSNQIIDWLNRYSQWVGGARSGSYTGALPVDIASATPIKEISVWGAVVPGTSPAAVAADYEDFFTFLDDSGWEDFLIRNRVTPQCFCMLTPDPDVHVAAAVWAASWRGRGYPVSFTTGVAWGDVQIGAGDDTDPTFRAAAVNSQDMVVAAPGLDRVAAYLSMGPALWGIRAGSGLLHNATNDVLRFSLPEARWKEITAKELTQLCKKGVATYKVSTALGGQYVVCQGLTTLQANATAWNTDTDDTCLWEQRDLVDFLVRLLKDTMERLIVGTDEVDRDALAGGILVTFNPMRDKYKYITGFSITSIERDASGAGWDAAVEFKPTPITDYVLVNATVRVE